MRQKPIEKLDSTIVEWKLQPSGNWKKVLDAEWLHEKYVVEELSIEEIGRLANINPRLITIRAKELGLPIRSRKRRYELRAIRHAGWSKGLTKETHPTLRATSERQKKNSHFADPKWRVENLFTEEVKAKRAAGIKKAHQVKWGAMTLEETQNELSRIWKNKSPNQTEQLLLSLCPDTVEFVGNGQHWITFKTQQNKNPDFVVRPFSKTKKVIEYFGSYWHPRPEEPEELISLYKEVGVSCLVITQLQLADLTAVQESIESFCNSQ